MEARVQACCLPVIGLPGIPRSVSIIEISPTTVLLDIQPPENTGGVDIYGFRIQYLLKIDDFMIGTLSLTFLCTVCVIAVFVVLA